MPISFHRRDNHSHVLEVVVSGKLTHTDYERFGPEFERVLADHGKIRLLMDMIDFHGWEPLAVWDDIKFVFKHAGDFARIAMVGDKKWEEGMSKVCAPFTAAEVRYFDWTELREAREWVAG